MRKFLLLIAAIFVLSGLRAQRPWWPVYESISIPNDTIEVERVEWDPSPFTWNPDYPFLNLLAERPADLVLLNDDGCLHAWRIGADVTTFFRDAEFSTQLTRGYTAVGYFFTPHVSYLLQANAQVTLGADLTGIAGQEGFWKARPLVRIEYRPFAHWTFVMGTLYGGNSHHLYEPMWCIENTFLDHTEQGLEIFNSHNFKGILGRSRLVGDTWLNWQNFLEPWEPEQEVFTAGTSQRLSWEPMRMMHLKVPYRISLPFSFVGQHHGGQFSALDTCVTSLFNESVGLSLDMFLSKNHFSFYKGSWLTIDLPWFCYQNASPGSGKGATPYASGQGFFPQITYQHFFDSKSEDADGKWDRLTAQVGYWHGSQWIAPVGSYHFQSVSWHRDDYLDPTRRMATSRIAYERYQGRMTFGADLEVYHDLNHAQTDCAFGLYMRAKL